MSVAEKEPHHQKLMVYALRPMESRDVEALTELDQEAFPTTWPPTSFRRELSNRLAHYLVAYEWREEELAPEPAAQDQGPPTSQPSSFRRILGSVLGRDSQPQEPSSPPVPLFGFMGMWFLADEGHITSIATQQSHQGRGIGELLLIGVVELATLRGARAVTLEVRMSNHVAQSLYRKYNFKETGRRKRYYADNNEDALLMTTDPLTSPEYQALFQRLVEQHAQRWGHSHRVLD